MVRQNTIAKVITFSGKGLHTGKTCRVTLNPAEENTGVVFRRTDLTSVMIKAEIANGCKLVRCSGLKKDGETVRTCEHLLAAFYACGVDNVIADIDSEEIPIFDGSAEPLVVEVKRAGLQVQRSFRQVIEVLKPVESRDGERFVRIEPADELSIDLSLTLDGFPHLSWSGNIEPENFEKEIASARTFSPLKHALPVKIFSCLTGMPIARGANLNNLLVFGWGRVLNPGGERLDNELARHRVLDVVGDLALAGASVRGKITAFRSSHSLNQDLVHSLMSDRAAWRKVPIKS